MAEATRERHVVTSFIVSRDVSTQDEQVLLLKRSAKENTYQHCWAGVSGALESTDSSSHERALTEIREETTLTSSDVKLIRHGRPLTIFAEEISTVWKVHPFLFRLVSGSNKIQIDWEHETYQWVRPSDISTFKTVPNLLEAFRRVYLPENVHCGLKDIYNNRSSGAQQLSFQALSILGEAIEPCYEFCKTAKDLYLALLNVGWHLVQIRPAMKAPISYSIVGVLKRAKDILEQKSVGLIEFGNQILGIIDEFKQLSIEAKDRLVKNFQAAIIDSQTNKGIDIHIMTTSHSSTVYDALANLIRMAQTSKSHKVLITIMESRPLCEGALELTKKLSTLLPEKDDNEESCVQVQLITDASCGLFMPTATHVLLGADHVLGDNGAVVNKVGSVPLALTAKHYGKKVLVITQTDKIASTDKGEEIEENEASEVTDTYGNEWVKEVLAKSVKVRNLYFEKVEAQLIDLYVTEQGILNTQGINDIWKERMDNVRLFKELDD